MKEQKKFEKFFFRVTENKFFEIFIAAVIILSALMIGLETLDYDSRPILFLISLDYFVTIIFLIEVIFKILREERKLDYFKSGWNVFDFTVVAVSLVPIPGSNFALLGRLLRIFRLLRIISVLPELRLLITSLIRAIPNIVYISLLLFVLMYIYAAVGTVLFKEADPASWGNILISLLTLFNILTFDNWTELMYTLMDAGFEYAWVFFVSFIMISVFTFLNLFIGILLSNMEKEAAKVRKEHYDEEKENKKLQIKISRLEKKIDLLLNKKN